VLESGDVFAMLPMVERPNHPYQTCVQLIEADRVSNPTRKPNDTKMASGVEKDSNGAPVAYHVQVTHPGDLKQSMQWTRVPAFGAKTGRRNMLHLYHKLRPTQSRGVPDLAPVIETLKQMGRYTDSELMAAVVTGMFAVFFKKEASGGLVPASNDSSPNGYQDFKSESGRIGELGPDESIEMVNPNRPSTSFDPFMMAIMRQIGVALELPFEVLIKHFTASYSASRAALLEAWRFFKNRRTWMAQNFCNPIYEAWLTEAVASGRIYAPGFLSGDAAIRMAYCGCEWIGPAPSQLDPLKEMKANELAVNMGVTSLSKVVAETNGGDWELVHAQRKKEVAMRKEAGLDAVVLSADIPPDQNQDGGNT
jgi:lambda family phage portal protein